ncbi:prolipoprotein diacylglyceryl transferase [Flagellimonas sediminis]|uniref:Diacylglyceryl transferase n=1 Tax=Flagellimonas sediminis TaxID=2696468 RepID=A0A6I5KVK1_9FLAO|nr:prolipoprotein diacylglyceryl transferase family protein [Allomuricauda sediminis]NDV42452.1 diacylglyceryl transferase [Allomuricauda sediminis]
MTIPFEPSLFGIKINIHLILEYLAFFIGFRYYVRLRRLSQDNISNGNRLSIILGAIAGAFIGSRLMGFLENPMISMNTVNMLQLLNTKSIMGGLFGGLIGVELSKKIIHEKQSSGDLFTFPIILGILIGRLGCFLSGTNEFTYGKETHFFTGMNLGDGLLRHPTSLYEMVFLILLFVLLKRFSNYLERENGLLFKVFMLAYFGFRFFIEFLKPNVFYVLGLSSIQWLCIVCWLYYLPTLNKLVRNAY